MSGYIRVLEEQEEILNIKQAIILKKEIQTTRIKIVDAQKP